MSDYIGTRDCGLLHIAERPVADVLAGHYRTRPTINGHKYHIHQGSLRYQTFAKSCVCCCCGIVGSRMLLDTPREGSGCAHFNLYAEWNGELVLMTRDHILPRSKGGKDTIANMRTMCTTCNGHRGNLDVSLDELYESLCGTEADRLLRESRSWQMLLQNLKDTGYDTEPKNHRPARRKQPA
jgi:hypothetical protein